MENKIEIQLSLAHLRACYLFTATNDVRFYLCGVKIEKGLTVATNGHALMVCKNEQISQDIDLIIPRETIRFLNAKVGTRNKSDTVFLSKVENSEYWMLQHLPSMCAEVFLPIDGAFPKWEKVDIPEPKTSDLKNFPMFNFAYLNDLFKANCILSGSKVAHPVLKPTTANGSCYVEMFGDNHAIIMPMRI